MDLKTYLKTKNIKVTQFSKETGINIHTVRSYILSNPDFRRTPRKKNMNIIIDHTNGWVQPKDFLL